MLRQMLVAVDFSVWSRYAAQHACDVARAIGGRVTLLHVLEAHDAGSLKLEEAHTLLQELSLLARRPPNCLIVPARNRLDSQSPGADGLSDGNRPEDAVALTILEVADQLGAELIVIGLHGQGSPAERMLGQVVHQVLLDAHVPVQVVTCSAKRPTSRRWGAALAERAAL